MNIYQKVKKAIAEKVKNTKYIYIYNYAVFSQKATVKNNTFSFK